VIARRTTALVLAVASASFGCVGIAPPQPEAYFIPETAYVPPVGTCVRDAGLRLAAGPPVPLEALRALIGRRVDEPSARDLLATLGPRKIDPRGRPTSSSSIWGYAKHGLGVEVSGPAGEEVVRSVQLEGASMYPAYPGALPEGLDFAMTVRETFAKIGLPDEGRLRSVAWMRHHYGERGLSVQFSHDGCLSVVGLERPLAQGTIAFDAIRVDELHADLGLTGLAVRFERTVGAMPQALPMTFVVELFDERDAPIRGLSGSADGPIGKKTGDQAVSSNGVVVFIPYLAMDLAPGPHRLHGRVRAEVAGPDGTRELPAATPATFDFAFTMPEIVSVRVGVREAVAARGVWDAAHRPLVEGLKGLRVDEIPTHYDRPDLRFHVVYSTSRDGQMFEGRYTSPARDDAFEARWTELSQPFLAAPRDTFLVCIEDEDTVTPAEEVGCVTLTAESLKKHAAARTPLRDRKLERMILADPRVVPARATRAPRRSSLRGFGLGCGRGGRRRRVVRLLEVGRAFGQRVARREDRAEIDDVDPAVVAVGVLRLLADGLALALRRDDDAARGDAEIDQALLDVVAALLGERVVVVVGAARIGSTDEADAHLCVLRRVQARREILELLIDLRERRRLVEREPDLRLAAVVERRTHVGADEARGRQRHLLVHGRVIPTVGVGEGHAHRARLLRRVGSRATRGEGADREGGEGGDEGAVHGSCSWRSRSGSR
jgi:hypothetical protein